MRVVVSARPVVSGIRGDHLHPRTNLTSRTEPEPPSDEQERIVSQPTTGHDALVNEPVTVINAFTVPKEEAERFQERWTDTARILNRIMADQPGFIRARLYRSLVADAEPRFVNVSEWDSANALDAAQANPEWRATVQRLLGDPDLHVTARPAVYQVAVDVHPGDPL